MKVKRILAGLVAAIMLFSATVTVMAAEDAKSFSDVPADHWAHTYVTELSKAGVISGYLDGSFKPDAAVTRAEWAKMLCVAGEIEKGRVDSPISDVAESDWYAKYASAVVGYMPFFRDNNGNTLFAPMDEATRDHVTVSIVAVKEYIIEAADKGLVSRFADADTISEQYEADIAAAVEKGLITGFEDNTFRAKDTLTRAEAATLLYRAFFAEDSEAAAVVDPADEAAIRSVIDEFFQCFAMLDPAAFDFVAKDSKAYSSLQNTLKTEEQLAEEAESRGITEEKSKEYGAILVKYMKDIVATHQYEVKSVAVEGDYAKVNLESSMLNLNTSTASDDINAYMTEEEIKEMEENAQTMDYEEYMEYASDLVVKVLPKVYEAEIETSEVVTSNLQYILQKIDGNWIIIAER